MKRFHPSLCGTPAVMEWFDGRTKVMQILYHGLQSRQISTPFNTDGGFWSVKHHPRHHAHQNTDWRNMVLIPPNSSIRQLDSEVWFITLENVSTAQEMIPFHSTDCCKGHTEILEITDIFSTLWPILLMFVYGNCMAVCSIFGTR